LTFRGYGDSENSNQVGVSTLAITRDGWLVLTDQLDAVVESAGRLAPSGSGSLDWSDLPEGAENTEFWSWLLKASTRELREELGIEPSMLSLWKRLRNRQKIRWMNSVSVESVLIGFAGFLHRGGKPDFFFLARLGCSINELRTRAIYGKEELRMSKRRAVVGNQPRLKAFKAAELRNIIERNRSPEDSFPLALGYKMLDEICVTCPREVEAFLLGEPVRTLGRTGSRATA